MEWTDVPWICARATVDDPPGWLRTYQTRASFGRWDVHSTIHADGWERVTSALVKEVSILSPATEPAEPLASALSFRPIEERTARASHETAPGAIVVPGDSYDNKRHRGGRRRHTMRQIFMSTSEIEMPLDLRDRRRRAECPPPSDEAPCYSTQKPSWSSRTESTPMSGPNSCTHKAIAPGGGGNASLSKCAQGQVVLIPLTSWP
jgi:hypothetical protein